ncbi:hypothetical protein [Agitococcus lubricus]|uniref:hypothetical protein n=1 Tax=Agitococcus lubricus TaxID=1077255 RepID=UPI000D2F65EB|nr:hypothetical protein [Agitococcus lubricus]
MFSYLIAWIVYIVSVYALFKLYHRSLATYLPESVRPVLGLLFLTMMLTPWPIDSETWILAPAIVASLFHLLSGFTVAALKSLFPILVVSSLSCFVAWWMSRKRSF